MPRRLIKHCAKGGWTLATDLLLKALQRDPEVADLILKNQDVAGAFLSMFDLIRAAAEQARVPIENVRISGFQPVHLVDCPKGKEGEVMAKVKYTGRTVAP